MRYLKIVVGSFFVFIVLAGASCDTQTTVTTSPQAPLDTADIQFQDEASTPQEADESTDERPVIDATTSTTAEKSTPAASVEVEGDAQTEDTTQETVAPQTRVFDVRASRFVFEPSTIEVNQGDTVVINFTSAEVTHGLNIPEFGVNLIAPVGETVTTQFVATTAGTFTFRCSVYCGAGHAEMRGTLIVHE